MLSVSRRRAATPFIFRNTEADELHFVQEGTFRYTTDFGVLEVGPGDFVWLGRTITYEVEPTGDECLRIIVETPEPLGLNPPAPFGMINMGRDVRRPTLVPPPHDRPRELWLKAFDGITRFRTVHDRSPAGRSSTARRRPGLWVWGDRDAVVSRTAGLRHRSSTPSTDLCSTR
jgi:homogentisate 1,2-dioxygenase